MNEICKKVFFSFQINSETFDSLFAELKNQFYFFLLENHNAIKFFFSLKFNELCTNFIYLYFFLNISAIILELPLFNAFESLICQQPNPFYDLDKLTAKLPNALYKINPNISRTQPNYGHKEYENIDKYFIYTLVKFITKIPSSEYELLYTSFNIFFIIYLRRPVDEKQYRFTGYLFFNRKSKKINGLEMKAELIKLCNNLSHIYEKQGLINYYKIFKIFKIWLDNGNPFHWIGLHMDKCTKNNSIDIDKLVLLLNVDITFNFKIDSSQITLDDVNCEVPETPNKVLVSNDINMTPFYKGVKKNSSTKQPKSINSEEKKEMFSEPYINKVGIKNAYNNEKKSELMSEPKKTEIEYNPNFILLKNQEELKYVFETKYFDTQSTSVDVDLKLFKKMINLNINIYEKALNLIHDINISDQEKYVEVELRFYKIYLFMSYQFNKTKDLYEMKESFDYNKNEKYIEKLYILLLNTYLEYYRKINDSLFREWCCVFYQFKKDKISIENQLIQINSKNRQ